MRTTPTPEGRVKKKIKAVLDAHNIFHFSPNMNGYSGKAGIPDIIACVRGHLVSIEVKADAKKPPSKLQMRRMSEIRQSGGLTLLVHDGNFNEFKNLVQEMATTPSVWETVWASDLYYREQWNDNVA